MTSDECLIRSAHDIESYVLCYGFVPFFACDIPHLSIQELTAPEHWFTDEEGPWEWKGQVIREGKCAYGKFFRRKAGFVSLDWLPDFANFRRSVRYSKNDDIAALDDIVLQAIAAEGSATVKELRHILGFAQGRGNRKAGDLVDAAVDSGKISLEPILTRLMMNMRIVISDFEYNIDRHGNPYGWGVARYTLPETLYGPLNAGCSPEESYDKIIDFMHFIHPYMRYKPIRTLIT